MTVPSEVLRARAYLSRIAEATCIPLWAAVERDGPLEVAAAIRNRTADADVLAATDSRASSADPDADLDAAQRCGMRLVVPESADWPHFALACLTHTGRLRVARYRAGETTRSLSGELMPPLALWVKGQLDPSVLGVRSVALVGARAATSYGCYVACELASGLSTRGYTIVSGGAFGIDAAAHRAALSESGPTVLVSAGGLDRAYPPAHAGLFEAVESTGLLVSESPPGAAPARHRFLTRNRLIAALSTGTIIVEAAMRSGALNTAGHCRQLGRPVMVVPGPITSALSAGVHHLLFTHPEDCRLVARVEHVVEVVGGFGEMQADGVALSPAHDGAQGSDAISRRLDSLDDVGKDVYNAFPARRAVTIDELAVVAGRTVMEVIRSIPTLQLLDLIRNHPDGLRRIGKPVQGV